MPRTNCVAIISPVALAVSTVLVWVKDFNAGAFLSAASILGVGLVALVGTVVREGWKVWADFKKKRAQLNIELEELNKGSLSKQLEDFRRTTEERDASVAGRLEDANRKLHEERNARQSDRLNLERLTGELQVTATMLTEANKRIGEMNGHMDESNARITKLMADLEKSRMEREELAAKIGHQVMANSDAIVDLQRHAPGGDGP